ncbi:MAG TPA: alpha/beta fold hydrolase [Polyangiales bacterium]|jgi:pimeloyl-ACP methyl ester carboxylesterase
MLARLEESIGAGILRLVQVAQRRAVRAQLKQHVDARGRVTPYLECGVAKEGTLVWLHGFSDEPDSFLRTAAQLVDRYRIVAPAMPGFADGWADPAERHTFEAYAEWLGEVVSAVGGERFHLMGNSLGGATAIGVAAALGPERVVSLVPVNSAGLELVGVRAVGDEMRAGQNLFAVRDPQAYRQFIKRIFAQPPYIPRPVLLQLTAKLRRSADWYDRLIADMTQSKGHTSDDGNASSIDLTSLRVPTLVVWGDRDTLFPLAHGEHFARAIPGAKLEVLEGVGHCPHLEAPTRLADAFSRFAASLG